MPTAWITGAGGLIGSHLVRTAPLTAPRFQILAPLRAELDLTDFQAVREYFERHRPLVIIHCAALSQSPACEAQPALARHLNVEVTKVLAELAAEIQLFFFSTDLVFDGREGNYDEAAPVNPLSVYGETKVAAEQRVLVNPRHTVIRTSLNGGISPSGNRGFNEQLRQAWAAGKVVTLFKDEYRAPLGAEVTARAVWELIEQGRTGIYHVAGRERLSRWEIGKLVAERHPELGPRIEAASVKDHPALRRPPDSSLNCAKVQALLTFALPEFSAWLARQPPGAF